jgi:hypothetical protein
MNNYLNSLGYYYANFSFPIVKFDTLKDQIRTSLLMSIDLGKNIIVDTVSYIMLDSILQRIAKNSSKQSPVQKGNAYTKQSISNELDRLTSLYRDSGFYKITRDDFFAFVDSTNDKLLKLTFNPYEQTLLLIEAAKSKKENPKWDVSFREKPPKDSSTFNQFKIGTTYFYTETKAIDVPDSLMKSNQFNFTVKKDLVIKDHEGKYLIRPLRDNIYLRKDSLYNETKIYKSINNLSRIGTWQQVDLKINEVGKDSLDLHYFLVPSIKHSYEISLEGTRNTGDIASSNLLGISTTLSYRNRNVWKQGIQSVSSIRGGIELNTWTNNSLNNNLVQTLQGSLNHTYSFPRLIQPFNNWSAIKKLDNKKTNLNIGAAYTDRKDYYRLRSLSTNWAYEWLKGNTAWSFKPLNIELYGLDTLRAFDSLLSSNPFLRNSFRDGNVVGMILGATKTFNSKRNRNISHYMRFAFEEAGNITSLFIKSDRLFQYEKLELEYRYHHQYKKTDFAARYYVGAALPRSGQSTPVYKQFFLGGPNSMRAWGLRQLGLGTSILSDTSTTGYTDRFGDFAMEGNIEYRFTIWDFSSFKIASAVFADMGNVWSLKKEITNPNAEFNINRLGKDLAIGIGTGLRVDFSYFLIRLDVGYKVKDPGRQDANGLINGGWMSFPIKWTERRMNNVEIRNYTFQLGINLPF